MTIKTPDLGKGQGLRSSSALSWTCYLPLPLDTGEAQQGLASEDRTGLGTLDSLNGLSGLSHNTCLGSPQASSASPGELHSLVNFQTTVNGNWTSAGFMKLTETS